MINIQPYPITDDPDNFPDPDADYVGEDRSITDDPDEGRILDDDYPNADVMETNPMEMERDGDEYEMEDSSGKYRITNTFKTCYVA